MKCGCERIVLQLASFVIATLALAQRNTVATGMDASGSGGSMSYTLGQVDYTVLSNANGTVAQGVQQPYEFLVLSNNEPIGAAFSTTLLPNPTSTGVSLQLTGGATTELRYELFDGAGKLLRADRITSTTTAIPMEGLRAATYVLHVLQGDLPITTTRIVKH